MALTGAERARRAREKKKAAGIQDVKFPARQGTIGRINELKKDHEIEDTAELLTLMIEGFYRLPVGLQRKVLTPVWPEFKPVEWEPKK